jgi:hypothetical protein
MTGRIPYTAVGIIVDYSSLIRLQGFVLDSWFPLSSLLPFIMTLFQSIDIGSAEQTAHVLRILLAILGGNDNLVFFRRLVLGPVWMSFEENLCRGRAFAHFRDRSDVGLADRLSRRALLSLRFRRSFGCCLVVDWRSVSYDAHTCRKIGLDWIDSLARCNACSAMHRTCNHLRQSALEHCTINSSGFCGASSTHIFRKSCKFLVSKMSFGLHTSAFLPYRKSLCVCEIKRLSPEVFILLGHARLIIIGCLIPMLHF